MPEQRRRSAKRSRVLVKPKNPANNLLLERFIRRIPGFNERRQTMKDLIFLCDVLDIYFDLIDIAPLHGISLAEKGKFYLFVNAHLPPSLQVIAGFHELAHILDHPLNAHQSNGHLWNYDKLERQAQTVSVVALMPGPLLAGCDVGEVMAHFDVPFDIAMFRLSLPF